MRDLPILFSAPMVRSLIAGTKTQTRRALKPQPHLMSDTALSYIGLDRKGHEVRVRPGDRVWVKETWSGAHAFRDIRPSDRESFSTPDGPVLRDDIWYWADGNPTAGDYEKPRSSMFMPRYASRITLLVDDVKVERLQDISEEDAIAEGIRRNPHGNGDQWMDYPEGSSAAGWLDPRKSYRSLWESINGDGSWDANPWVAAYTFRVVLENIDYIGEAA